MFQKFIQLFRRSQTEQTPVRRQLTEHELYQAYKDRCHRHAVTPLTGHFQPQQTTYNRQLQLPGTVIDVDNDLVLIRWDAAHDGSLAAHEELYSSWYVWNVLFPDSYTEQAREYELRNGIAPSIITCYHAA